MDFYNIVIDKSKKVTQIGPLFRTIAIQDIIIDNKAQEVVAYWDEKRMTWSEDIAKLLKGIDKEVFDEFHEFQKLHPEEPVTLNTIDNVASSAYRDWLKFLNNVRTPKPEFNSEVLFSDHDIEREDYATYKLPYRPDPDVSIDEFLEGMSVFYDHENLDKLLWFIGATLTGDIHNIQKFAYLYGKAGSGKGTTIEIIKQIFQGPYTGQISLEKLTGKSEFASSQVRDLPVLYDPEVNLYRMTNDTPLLALTAHEPISVNRKFRDPVEVTFRGFLIAASNQPVKVRNIDAGINRRLVDIYQTGNKMTTDQYNKWMSIIPSQVPGIAHYAIQRYRAMGRSFFEGYVSQQMLAQTNYIHRFVRENYLLFTDPMPLGKAYEMYQSYLANDNVDFKVTRHDFQNDFSRYYDHTESKHQTIKGIQSKFWFIGFDHSSVQDLEPTEISEQPSIYPSISETFTSDFNYFNQPEVEFPAQYATSQGIPAKKWHEVTTTNHDIDQTKLHYIQAPSSILVIDIDNHHPNTDRPVMEVLSELNLPETFAEPSRSGKGIHLYFQYNDSVPLKQISINDQIEVKPYNGLSSIRRQFTHSNGVVNLATINFATLKPLFDKLPKEKSPVIDEDLKRYTDSEEQLRTWIKKALKREINPNTKPNVDFIQKVVQEAIDSDVTFNIKDLEPAITTFALSSTNQSEAALKIALDLTYQNPPVQPTVFEMPTAPTKRVADRDLMFYDVEVFRNVFMFSYYKQSTMNEPATLINPTQSELYDLVKGEALVGFNNYRYDDFILYYALIGYTPMQLFNVSQMIISDKKSNELAFKAHDISYADLYEIAVTKQSLKKWEVELGLPYDEVDTDWNEPLPEDLWERVASYNRNDTRVLPELLKHLYGDYEAALVLAALSGLPLNRTINSHTTQIIFTLPDGTRVKPDANETVYTDLSQEFPGYEFDRYKGSSYMGLNPSNGGYVYSQPGVYKRAVELDLKSMHPTSAVQLNYFGRFTPSYKALMDVKFHLSDGDLKAASKSIPLLADILSDPSTNVDTIIKAVKRAINSAYGLTSASFDNPLKNPQNIDNIVAKRGALFMITLQRKLESEGVGVIHIKTDSIKLDNPTEEQINEVIEFASTYGYQFKIEDTYTPFVLIDKAQLIGYSASHESWHAIGTKFINPYTYKTLFSHEDYVLSDYRRVIESRTGKLFLGGVFVGRIGAFIASENGDTLMIHRPDGTESSPAGTISKNKHQIINPETGRKKTVREPYKFIPYSESITVDIDFSFYEEFVKTVLNDIMALDGIDGLNTLFPDTAQKLIAQYELLPLDLSNGKELKGE